MHEHLCFFLAEIFQKQKLSRRRQKRFSFYYLYCDFFIFHFGCVFLIFKSIVVVLTSFYIIIVYRVRTLSSCWLLQAIKNARERDRRTLLRAVSFLYTFASRWYFLFFSILFYSSFFFLLYLEGGCAAVVGWGGDLDRN